MGLITIDTKSCPHDNGKPCPFYKETDLEETFNVLQIVGNWEVRLRVSWRTGSVTFVVFSQEL